MTDSLWEAGWAAGERAAIERLDVDGITDLIAECHLRPEGVSPRQIAEEVVAYIRRAFDEGRES